MSETSTSMVSPIFSHDSRLPVIRMVIIKGWLMVWPPPVLKLITWDPAAQIPVMLSPPWPGVSMTQTPGSDPIGSA